MLSEENKKIISEGIDKYNLKKISKYLFKKSFDVINITLEKIEENYPIGSSKFGGLPHLPNGFIWPKNEFYEGNFEYNQYCPFLGQLNFEEIKKFDTYNILPNNGMLYLFFFFNDVDDLKIFYSDNLEKLEVKNLPEGYHEEFYEFENVEFKAIFTHGLYLPYFLDLEFEENNEQENYSKFRMELIDKNILSDFYMLGKDSILDENDYDKKIPCTNLLNIPSLKALSLDWFSHEEQLTIQIKNKDLKKRNFESFILSSDENYIEWEKFNYEEKNK